MISLSTADSALKNVYLEVIANQLNNDVDPFYAKISQITQDITGNEIKKLISVGINGGIGAGTEVGSLPTPKENNYLSLTSKLKNLYGTLEISDKALRASRDEAGAFLNLLNAEVENLIESSKFNLRRMLYGDGTGYLTQTSDGEVGSNVYGVADAGSLAIGMRVDGYLDGEVASFFKEQIITDIDYNASTITVQSTLPEENELDTILDLYITGSKDKEFIGLKGVCDTTNIKTLYGINRSDSAIMNPTTQTITTMTVPAMVKVIDDLSLASNANTDFIACGFTFRRNLQKLLRENSINLDVLNLEGGFKTISFNGIPVLATKFINDYQAYFIDSSVWHLHQLCDWTWLTNNKGEVIKQREGYPTHTATLVKYCDLICDRPNTISRVSWYGNSTSSSTGS